MMTSTGSLAVWYDSPESVDASSDCPGFDASLPPPPPPPPPSAGQVSGLQPPALRPSIAVVQHVAQNHSEWMTTTPQKWWSTMSEAMSALCLKIIKVIKIIVLWSEDSDPNHKDRKIWATSGLLILRSTGGFAKLLRFGIDTDYTYMCHKLVMVQDKSARHIAA